MKTLDETIEAITKQSGLEIRNVRKPEKDRFWVDRETYNAALNYLKEYKEKQKTLKIRMAEYKSGFEQLGIEWARIKDNPPITWDELKTMEGKPIWVEQHHGDTKGWLLILRKCDDVVTCTTKHGNSFYLFKANYGEKWQAYRKERDHD